MDQNIYGVYDRIVVEATSATHSNAEVPISWINQFAFYFNWSDDNHQIWVYDVEENGLRQICNKVEEGFMDRLCKKHTDSGLYYHLLPDRETGSFNGTEVKDSKVCHSGRELKIKWLNPYAFYFKWDDDGNEQVWVYDSSAGGYLQIGNWKNAVKGAQEHKSEQVHQKD